MKLAGERPRVPRRNATRALEARVRKECCSKARGELVERLMRQRDAETVFASLTEDGFDRVVKILLRLVHVDVGGSTVILGNRGALQRCLREHGNEKASEKLAPLGLE